MSLCVDDRLVIHTEWYIPDVALIQLILLMMDNCCPKHVDNRNKGKVIPLQAGVAQRVGRVIALIFHDRGSRRRWVVSSTSRSHFTPVKDPVPILQAGWATGPVWMGGKSRLHRDSIPDHPARSQSLYRLRYPAHTIEINITWNICASSWFIYKD